MRKSYLYYPIFKGLGLKLRNRIVWKFEHGLHASRRFSGRYETILWFTKSDRYVFHLDAVRVPAKYPGKRHFKGPNKGKPSGNPLGKNPSDVWEILVQDWAVCLGSPTKAIGYLTLIWALVLLWLRL